jgi:large subunit ribosomal protein L9
VKRHQIDMQPIRNLGEFTAHVRLTIDLMPEIKIIVHREGEAVEGLAQPAAVEKPVVVAAVEEAPASESEEISAEPASEVEEK